MNILEITKNQVEATDSRLRAIREQKTCACCGDDLDPHTAEPVFMDGSIQFVDPECFAKGVWND